MIIPYHRMIVMFDHGCQPGRFPQSKFAEFPQTKFCSRKIIRIQTTKLGVPFMSQVTRFYFILENYAYYSLHFLNFWDKSIGLSRNVEISLNILLLKYGSQAFWWNFEQLFSVHTSSFDDFKFPKLQFLGKETFWKLYFQINTHKLLAVNFSDHF